MGFDIAKFRSHLSQKGLLKTNKFLVLIEPPPGMKSSRVVSEQENDVAAEIADALVFHCDSVVVPGIILLNSEARRYGYGPIEKKPFTGIYSEVPMTFMVDGNGDNLRFFQNWVKLIYNHDNRDNLRTATGLGREQYPFEISYKDEYATTIQILIYNDNGGEFRNGEDEAVLITLREAWPHTIVDMPLNWSDNNNIMRLPVIFTCFDWYEKKLTVYDGNYEGALRDVFRAYRRRRLPNNKRNELGD